MSVPPAAVISPPAMDGEPPSPVTKLRTPPSPLLGGTMSMPPDPPSSTAPELSPASPKLELDFAHAGIVAPSARVKGRARGRVNHRMTNPSRADGALAFVRAITYHASLEMRPPKVVYLYGLPSRPFTEHSRPAFGSRATGGCPRPSARVSQSTFTGCTW